MAATDYPKRDLFFLPCANGELFSVFYHPINNASAKGSVLYVHPFADEMNKSRRMAALQAWAFAQAGLGVLQVDLLGCGDSSRDFGDATWADWKKNINSAVHWLHQNTKEPVSLWGLRLGALLMMDWAKDADIPIKNYIFWQPVLNGALAMNQFFRLAAVSKMLGKEGSSSADIRKCISQGEKVEIGGYELHPDLIRPIESIKMEDLCPPANSRVIWKDISLNDPPVMGPAVLNAIDFFKQNRCRVEVESITGNAFWNSIEISTLPALIESTTASVTGDKG